LIQGGHVSVLWERRAAAAGVGYLAPEELYVFAEEGPYAGEVGDVDSDGGFAGVPEHVDGRIDVLEIVYFG
jgi:hypothetical protein